MKTRIFLVTTGFSLICITLFALPKNSLLKVIKSYRQANEHTILKEYVEFLSIPNVSSDKVNVRKNAEHIKSMMEARDVKVQLLETPGNPIVFGEYKVKGAKQTLMFYVHYDGQPVDSTKWIDHRPFEPILRPGKMEAGTTVPKPIPFPKEGEPINPDWRLYARSTSDDKAPIMALVTAMDALKNNGMELNNNIKFIFEGEEEAGSTNLRWALKKYKNLLDADVLFICDGPVYFSGDPTVDFGVRGITSVTITVYGPNVSLHSGHYGNWAPNPAMRLAQLLATMKDKTGRITIPGFYDTVTPLTETEIQAIKANPNYDEVLKKLYGFSDPEGGGMSLNEAIQWPSLNVRGMQSGWVGKQARTIIPDRAIADIDIRLVKGCDPKEMVQKVVDHIRAQGYHVVDDEPDQETRMKYPRVVKVRRSERGYKAARTPMDLPIAQQVIKALKEFHAGTLVLLPTMGGSVPIYLFEDELKIPTIGVPIANYDNNQHQPNENIRIGHLWTGIETFAALLMMEQ